jgi:DNA-binding transcriptional LysR family regulator
MSQPPLSRQIAALERDVGTALFMRSPKGVDLTPAGHQFRLDATEILRLVARAKRNAEATGRGEAGSLSMGFTMCAAYSVVPDLTRRYKHAFPDVDLHVRELLPSALESGLKDGVIDIAISFPIGEGSRFEARPLFRERLDLVLPERHRLAKTSKIRVEDLSDEPFLIVPHDQVPSLHEGVTQRCRAAGFEPTIALEVYLQQTIVNFVAEGLGIAFVPASMQRSQIKGAVFRRVADPPMIDQLLYWSPANKNPCLGRFLGLAKS